MINSYYCLANRYKDVPNVIFELLNEPSVLDPSLAGTPYKSFNEDVITAIESAETISHLKIVELLHLDPIYEENIDTAVDISKQNVVWATHTYYPMTDWDPAANTYHDFTFRGQYYPQDSTNMTTYVWWRIARCADLIHSWNKPWINTEFSKDTTQAYCEVWYRLVLETQAENNITGWTFHCYCSNPNGEWYWNINNSTTRQKIITIMQPFMT